MASLRAYSSSKLCNMMTARTLPHIQMSSVVKCSLCLRSGLTPVLAFCSLNLRGTKDRFGHLSLIQPFSGRMIVLPMPVAALPISATGPSAVEVQSIVHSTKANQLGHHLPPLLRMMQRATNFGETAPRW